MPQAVVRAFVGKDHFQSYACRQTLISGRDCQWASPAWPMQAELRPRTTGADNQRDVEPIAHNP